MVGDVSIVIETFIGDAALINEIAVFKHRFMARIRYIPSQNRSEWVLIIDKDLTART